MSVWRRPALSARVLEAWQKLRQPSVPRPLPDSIEIGSGEWHASVAPDLLVTAYLHAGSPIPAGSKTTRAFGGLLVESPFSSSAIFARKSGAGSVYRILTEPNLASTGTVVVETFARAGIMVVGGSNEVAALAEFQVNGTAWCLDLYSDLAARSSDDSDENGPKPRTAWFGAGALADVLKHKPERIPAAVEFREGSLKLTLKMAGGEAVVTLQPTEGLIQYMAACAPDAYAATMGAKHEPDKGTGSGKPAKKKAAKKTAPAKKKKPA